MNRTSFASVLLLACVAGCGPRSAPPAAVVSSIAPAKLEAGKEADLMPFKVGNIWVYSYEQTAEAGNGQKANDRKTLTWKVVKLIPRNGGTDAVLEVTANGDKSDRQVWRVDQSGLYQVSISNRNVLYQPPLTVCRFPMKIGTTVKWSGQGLMPVGTPGKMAVDVKSLGSQEVDTDMGRMSAIAIESLGKFAVKGKPGIAVNTVWFRPGVGLVRYRSEVAIPGVRGITVLKLKSTNVKS